MPKTSLKYALLGVLAASAISVVVSTSGAIVGTKRAVPAGTVLPSAGREPVGGDVLWATNQYDNRRLMGSSHNVFVGRVVKQIGTRLVTPTIPWTQFEVEVILNIKGNLRGSIVLNQVGGMINGQVMTLTDVAPLLQPGRTYLLSVGYVNGEYHMSGHPNAWKEISTDTRADKARLRAIAESDEKVRVLKAAYSDEVLSIHDVRGNTTYNSYASRCLDATGELIDDTVELVRAAKGLPKAECATRLTPAHIPNQAAKPLPSSIATPPLVSDEPVRDVKEPPPPPAPPVQ